MSDLSPDQEPPQRSGSNFAWVVLAVVGFAAALGLSQLSPVGEPRAGPSVAPSTTASVAPNLSLSQLSCTSVVLSRSVSGSFLVGAAGVAKARHVRVRVFLGGAPIYEATVEVGGGLPPVVVEFEGQTLREGEQVLEAVAEAAGEEPLQDNRARRRVRVLDSRLRVLYVEGRPRWEYRWLAKALVRDPLLETQCLLAMAEPDFVQASSPGVAPLTGVPEAIEGYDVLILGDVDPGGLGPSSGTLLPPSALQRIKAGVKAGMSLLVVSGDPTRLFSNTPVAELLPVQAQLDPPEREFTQPWQPLLAREGRESALLRLGAVSNWKAWAALPPLYGFTPVRRAKPLAHVLVVHPAEGNLHGQLPLVAWQPYGAGTVFWLGIDELWRWRSEDAALPARLYRQILCFLGARSRGRSPNPVGLQVDDLTQLLVRLRELVSEQGALRLGTKNHIVRRMASELPTLAPAQRLLQADLSALALDLRQRGRALRNRRPEHARRMEVCHARARADRLSERLTVASDALAAAEGAEALAAQDEAAHTLSRLVLILEGAEDESPPGSRLAQSLKVLVSVESGVRDALKGIAPGERIPRRARVRLRKLSFLLRRIQADLRAVPGGVGGITTYAAKILEVPASRLKVLDGGNTTREAIGRARRLLAALKSKGLRGPQERVVAWLQTLTGPEREPIRVRCVELQTLLMEAAPGAPARAAMQRVLAALAQNEGPTALRAAREALGALR